MSNFKEYLNEKLYRDGDVYNVIYFFDHTKQRSNKKREIRNYLKSIDEITGIDDYDEETNSVYEVAVSFKSNDKNAVHKKIKKFKNYTNYDFYPVK